MKRGWITVLVIAAFISPSFSQKTTKNNYTGAWETNGSWVGNVPAAVANITAADLDLTINGFITRNGGLSFRQNNDGEDFIINDTLVVRGNISFENKAANLRLGPNSVFIVFGDFSASNKIVVENGGIFIVTGDVNFSPSGQDDYSNPGGGEIYVGGSVTGNDDAEEGEDNWGDLENDYPDIYEYVDCGGGPSCVLPVKLLYFHAVANNGTVLLSWATIMETNFQEFIVQRSSDGVRFENLGRTKGRGFDIHNIETKYEFTDVTPLLGSSYYRLMAVDIDETFEHFQVRRINVEARREVAVYPNPFSGRIISFNLNFHPEESARISLTDQLGVEIYSGPATESIARLEFSENLAPGIYILRYHSLKSEVSTRLLVTD